MNPKPSFIGRFFFKPIAGCVLCKQKLYKTRLRALDAFRWVENSKGRVPGYTVDDGWDAHDAEAADVRLFLNEGGI